MTERITGLLHEVKPYEDFDCNTQLFEERILDSLEFLEFLTMVEDEFGITVPDEMINSSNFATISKVADLVERLREEV